MGIDTIGSGTSSGLRHTHLRMAADALAEALQARSPADAVLRELYAKHRNAGARDRARVSDLLYGVLRDYFPLRAALGESATALELCAAQALRGFALAPESLPRLEGLDAHAIARRLAATAPAPLDAATRHNAPAWLWDRLVAQYGAAEASALALALNQPAPVDLRVNILKTSREQAAAALREDGVASAPTDRAAAGLRLEKREPLQRLRAFRDGWIEPQDEGSQLLAEFVAPKAGETVVDFCAGGGGKTLALGALMRGRGTLHAFDVSRSRLAGLTPRLQRSGLSIVQAQVLRHERDARLGALVRRCDTVLVDAPCSATGTWRRNPELRLREPDLPALAAQQRAILDAAAALVRPGGRLVYATCSVLKEENQDVAAGFLAAHPEFRADGELVLLPHRDGTDGFYGVRLLLTSPQGSARLP